MGENIVKQLIDRNFTVRQAINFVETVKNACGVVNSEAHQLFWRDFPYMLADVEIDYLNFGSERYDNSYSLLMHRAKEVIESMILAQQKGELSVWWYNPKYDLTELREDKLRFEQVKNFVESSGFSLKEES